MAENTITLDLGGDFHLENFRSLNLQRPQQSRQLSRPGRKFSVPAALGGESPVQSKTYEFLGQGNMGE